MNEDLQNDNDATLSSSFGIQSLHIDVNCASVTNTESEHEGKTVKIEMYGKDSTDELRRKNLYTFHMQKSQSTDQLATQLIDGRAEVRHVATQTQFQTSDGGSDSEKHTEAPTQAKLEKMMSKSLNLIYCAADDAYIIFLKNHTCSDLMPTSGKVLVIDSALTVKKAFYALVFNNTRAALISTVDKSGRSKFTGVLSISDFLELITLYYRSRHHIIRELEEMSIRSWKNQLNSNATPRSVRALPGIAGGGATRHLLHVFPNQSLYDTCALLERERVHRVPIIDPSTEDFLCFVTMKRILRYLFLAIYNIPRPSFLDKTIDELGIGSFCADFVTRRSRPHGASTEAYVRPLPTFRKIYTITRRTPVIDALRLLVRTGVSALPVVDATGRLRDLFSRFDVIHLAVAGSYSDLERPVETAMRNRRGRIEAVLCCHLEETLITIMVRMCIGQVHRLVIVDKSRRIIGILSLSDLMSFLTRASSFG